MSKHRVAVLKVVSAQLSVTAAAAECGISRGHLHRLLRRYRDGGLEAVEPRSRWPHTCPGRTRDAVRERIVALRVELTARGLDAGLAKPSSTPSGSPTTSSGRTGRSAARRPARRTGRHPGRCPPAPAPGATSASAATRPTARAPSPCGGPAACTTFGIGVAHARRRVLAIVDEQEVTVVALDTGEILSTHLIEPDRPYWRNQRRDPGRWSGSQQAG